MKPPTFSSDLDAQEPLAVGVEQVAKRLGVSPALVKRLDATGRLPRAIRLGKRKLWSVEVLRRWVAAGCPERDTWERAEEAGR